MSKQYNEDSMRSLGILGGVREKPASIGLENNEHTFLEILGNSIDEYRAGHGSVIYVKKHADGAVSVRDYGRGVPMGQNSEGDWVYKKVFDELWAGGKYDNNEEDGGNYQYSLGTNGVGATGTNYTSDYFTVTSFKEDGTYFIRYDKGVESPDGLHVSTVKNDAEVVGTEITWIPSKEVFRGKGEISDEFIIETLKDQAIVNGGLKFVFENKEGTETEFYYEDGVKGFINTLTDPENFLQEIQHMTTEKRGRDNEADKDYKIKADIYFAFNREIDYARYYHNSSWLEDGGTPEDFIKNSFTYVVDKYLKDNNLYTKNEKKVSFDDISDSLLVITSTYSTISIFTGQSKKKIDSDFMKKEITKWLREQLHVYFIENPKQATLIMKQILVNKHSRERAEKTRMDFKTKLSGTVNNITARVEGLVTCKSSDASKTEVYLVEGKSALGSTQQGRDPEFQAIYALRGKILNCLKAPLDKIFSNDIIVDLVKILGCGIEVKSKHAKDLNNFNLDNLRWSKVVICTDADVDGFHIRTLLLTMIHRLMPTLIEEGKVFIAESPLYEIQYKDKKGKDISAFAYSDQEKDELVPKIAKLSSYTIQRSKGLGENTARMMWDTTMNPETRRLIEVKPDDVEEVVSTFNLFLGDDLDGRKEYVEEHLHEYIEDALD